MKILVISDSHGHIANLKMVAEIAVKSKFDAIIHAGDWNNIESVKTILDSGIPLYTVMGNADNDPSLISNFKSQTAKFGEQYLIAKIGGRKIGITHKPSDNKKYLLGKKLDLIINGHLHSKYESIETSVKIIRPGAIINGINFAVYETVSGGVKFVQDV